MASQLLSQSSAIKHKLYGGNRSNGYHNKESVLNIQFSTRNTTFQHWKKLIRKSGKQHVTSFYRRFKTQSTLIVRVKNDRWHEVKTGKKQILPREELMKIKRQRLIWGRDRKMHKRVDLGRPPMKGRDQFRKPWFLYLLVKNTLI